MSVLRTPTRRAIGLRSGPWRGDHRTAYLAPIGDRRSPIRPDDITRCLSDLRVAGYRAAVTAALHPTEQEPFRASGFALVERLHLLIHPLDDLPRHAGHAATLGRGRRRDTAALLEVDHRAFSPFWRFDAGGLSDALTATASARLRVARVGGRIVGYAVSGRSGRHGYIQRLAVHPEHQRRGIGTALVADGLRWLKRRGARDALVNTQESNAASLRLYLRSGFVLQRAGLAVFRIELESGFDQ